MFTHDEWGNIVWHIQTGRGGLTLLKEAGFTNSMSEEEYKKHIESHNRIQKERNEAFDKWFEDLKEWCKT